MAIPLEPKPAELTSALSPSPADRSLAEAHRVSGRLAMVLGAILVAAFWPIVVGIWGSWFDDRAYMEHGILVVPAAAYMVWSNRQKLGEIAPRPALWGLLPIVVGAVGSMLGIVTQFIWISRMSLLLSLVGCIALVYGTKMIRALVYPLATLLLMITPPHFVFESLTLQLQLLASRLGAGALEALGYSVLREGNILEMVGIKLSVEEACSGIRSLVAIIFMCVLYNYFFVERNSMRAWILVLAVPIAILGNAVRIVATGVAGQYNPAWAGGATHEAFGYVSVVVAAAGCVGLHLLLLRLYKMREVQHA